MRPATGRIHHHLFHVGLLHALEKALEMAFGAPIRITLVHHAPFAQIGVSRWMVMIGSSVGKLHAERDVRLATRSDSANGI